MEELPNKLQTYRFVLCITSKENIFNTKRSRQSGDKKNKQEIESEWDEVITFAGSCATGPATAASLPLRVCLGS